MRYSLVVHCYLLLYTKFCQIEIILFCLVGWLADFLAFSSTTRLYRGRAPKTERLIILRAATHETELGDHDFCLSRSDYTDTDRISRERAATAGIEPGTSSPGVVRPPKIIHQCPMSQHIFLECTFLCRAVVGR